MTDRKQPEAGGAREEDTFLPPLEFSSIVAPFYTQALLKLGLLPDPSGAEPEENLPLVRRLIDLLDLLKDRTQGRLEPEEEKFFESILSQLKMHFIQKTDAIKL